jgi:ribulose bisphosphate carboxylase small subunit
MFSEKDFDAAYAAYQARKSYRILSAVTMTDLENQVVAFMRQGYALAGGTFYVERYKSWNQAIFRD